MVSTYQTRSTSELIAVKATLLAHIGTACDDTANRLAEHLDAIEDELGRRRATHPLIVRTGVDAEGEEAVTRHCPNCDREVRLGWTFCRTCGTALAHQPAETRQSRLEARLRREHRCLRCHRVLTDPASIALGYGKECAETVGVAA